MNTWHDLIKAWGGPYKFARDLGISEGAALMMSSRNNVHAKHWPLIVARAPQAGLQGVTLELLVSLKSGRDAKRGGRFRGEARVA